MTTEANVRMQRPLDKVDPRIADLLREEAVRQATGLELIPSENLVSRSGCSKQWARSLPTSMRRATRESAITAAAKLPTRWSQLAIDRAKQLFGADHAKCASALRNVGQRGGVYVRAEAGRYRAGMALAHGGHLTTRPPAELFGPDV